MKNNIQPKLFTLFKSKSVELRNRQKQHFARENISIASSTIEDWVKQALERLEPLYEQLRFDIKAKGYLQVDETSIKVLESDKKGAAHSGWYWVYHSPLDGLVLMDYQPHGALQK